MKSIEFEHAEHGEIQVNNGSTSFSDLFAIGAVALTSKQVHEKGRYYKKYPTDKEGLESISIKCGDATTFLHDATHSIGVLLAHADSNEIQSEIPSIAWLIAGLGELAEMVAMAQSNIDYTIKEGERNDKG